MFTKFPVDMQHKVYVDPKARISRDVLRNSGYFITMDKSKASYIIIPDVRWSVDDFCSHNTNMVVFDKTSNTTFCFYIINERGVELDEEVKNLIYDKISEAMGTSLEDLDIYHKQDFSSTKIWFIPNNEFYLDIMLNGFRYYNNKYILDSHVPIVPTFDITVDNLEMCSHMDIQFLEKFLVSCSWREYPVTLRYFLRNFVTCRIRDSINNNVKMILDQIHVNEDLPADYPVTPKDFNMLQDWLFHCIGLDGKDNGFVDPSRLIQLPTKSLLREKVAVSKLKLNNEVSFKQLEEMFNK